MKKLVLLCALAGMPMLAIAEDPATTPMPQGGGMGMQGGGMGMQGGGMGMQGGGMGQMGKMGPHHMMPAEFLAACQGKREGDTVTVNTPRGPVQGTCRLMFKPDQRPDGQGPDSQGQGTPPAKGATPGQRPPIR